MKEKTKERIELEKNIYKLQKGCQLINVMIILHFFYAFGQLVIVFIFLLNSSLYQEDEIGAIYLCLKGFQYLYDLFFTYKARIGNEQFKFVLNKLQVKEACNKLLKLFEYHKDKAHFQFYGYSCFIPQYNLFRFFKLLSFLFTILGNIIFYYNLSSLPIWVFIVQLIFAWFICCLCVLLFFGTFLWMIFRGGWNYYYLFEYNYACCSMKNIIPQQYSSLAQKSLQPCFICLQDYNNDDIVFQLYCKGNHMFHLDCIEQWKQVRSNCPVCREKI